MTATEMGECVMGAWLREVGGCDFVDYNVRPPVGGTEGQSEFDVVDFHFGERVAYMCEVLLVISRALFPYLGATKKPSYSNHQGRTTTAVSSLRRSPSSMVCQRIFGMV